MGPVSAYRLPTVVVVVVAAAGGVTGAVAAAVVVVVVVLAAGGDGTIVTVTLASFQDYCSRGCLRAIFIFGLPVSVVLRNIRYEFSDNREEIACSFSRWLSRSYGFSDAPRSSTSPPMLTSLFSRL